MADVTNTDLQGLMDACDEAIKFLDERKSRNPNDAPELIELAKLYIENIKTADSISDNQLITQYLKNICADKQDSRKGWFVKALTWVAWIKQKMRTHQYTNVHGNYTIVAGLQMQLAKILPDIALRQMIASVAIKFGQIFGESYSKQFDNITKKDQLEKLQHNELVAFLRLLISELYSAYIMNFQREYAINEVKRFMFSLYLIVLSGITIYAFVLYRISISNHETITHIYILIMMMLGITGALVSIVRRLQAVTGSPIGSISDPFLEIDSYRLGRVGMAIALFSGGVFPVLATILFASGIIGTNENNSLFPAFEKAPSDTGLSLFPRPAGNASFAKLAFWSFVAGFAERFIPDILDRMVERGLNRVGQAPSPKP